MALMGESSLPSNAKPLPRLALVVCLTALGIVLGVYGHMVFPAGPGERSMGFLDALFATVQMFTLKGSLPRGEKPVSLEVSRLLAIFVSLYAIRAVFVGLTNRFQRMLRRLDNHIVVVGGASHAGEIGRILSQGANAAFRDPEKKARLPFGRKNVTVVEIDDAASGCEMESEEIHYIAGDALGSAVWRDARAERAKRFVVATGDEIRNAEIADAIGRYRRDRGARHPVPCHIEVKRLLDHASFRQLKALRAHAGTLSVFPYNPHATAARLALLRNPLDGGGIGPDGPDSAHLFIVGFGRMGEELALCAAHMGHFANQRRVKITVCDPDGGTLRHRLMLRYPSIEQVVDLRFLDFAGEHPEARAALSEIVLEEHVRLTVAVCLPGAEEALEQALRLPESVMDKAQSVIVRLSRPERIRLFTDRPEGNARHGNLRAFGGLRDECDLVTGNVDQLAARIHEAYRVKARSENRLTPDIDVPWEMLDADLLDSNRRQADHLHVKLRAIGLSPRERGGDGENIEVREFNPDELEVLARMEHSRWMADRWLSGWTPSPPGTTKDSVHKTTPYLVPYDSLPDPIKEYDRDAVRGIPGLLNGAGLVLSQSTHFPSPQEALA